MSFNPLANLTGYASTAFSAATSENDTQPKFHSLTHNLITFLGAAQCLRRHLLPITWAANLDAQDYGGTASIQHSVLTKLESISSKRVRPEYLRQVLGRMGEQADVDYDALAYYALISEIKAAYLAHPNIVQLFGITFEVSHEGSAWPVLVYQKAPFGDLKTFITTHGDGQSWNQKLQLLLDIARGLQFRHTSAHMIHGDIKPENVLVFEDGAGRYRAKITDFGNSTYGYEDDDLVILSTTPGWAHPDRYNHGCRVDVARKIDVYSFGVLMFWVLFHGDEGYPNQRDIQLIQEHQAMLQHAQEFLRSSKQPTESNRQLF